MASSTAMVGTTTASSTFTLSMVTKYDNKTDGQTMNETIMISNFSEERLFQAVYLGYLWTALIIGLPGNVLIGMVYIAVKQKRTSDWFVFFLSVYDCAVCVFAVPLYLSIETGAWMVTGSDLACKIEQFTIFTAQFSSVSVLGVIAVDRYLKICHPTKRSLNATQARNLGMCTPLISAIVAAPILVWDGNVERRYCRIQEQYKRTLGVKIHLCLTFSFFVCMFLVVIFCYSHVCVVVRRRIRRHRENALKRKHLMQIPAFLQAISNVDDLHGLPSSQNQGSKKRFSLFSIGNSRRLSAISPWIKARLSLPSDNTGRKLVLPSDELKITTNESLGDIKRQLDCAMLFRAKSSTIEGGLGHKNETFKNKHNSKAHEMYMNEISTSVKNPTRTLEGNYCGNIKHDYEDCSAEGILSANLTNCHVHHLQNEGKSEKREMITVFHHSVPQGPGEPLFYLDNSDSQAISNLEHKTGQNRNIRKATSADCSDCQKLLVTIDLGEDQNAISPPEISSIVTGVENHCIENRENRKLTIEKTNQSDVKCIPGSNKGGCGTSRNATIPPTYNKIASSDVNVRILRSSNVDCALNVTHFGVLNQTGCRSTIQTGIRGECPEIQIVNKISEKQFINNHVTNINGAGEMCQKERACFAVRSLLGRKREPCLKKALFQDRSWGRKCKSLSCLLSPTKSAQHSMVDLIGNNLKNTNSESNLWMSPQLDHTGSDGQARNIEHKLWRIPPHASANSSRMHHLRRCCGQRCSPQSCGQGKDVECLKPVCTYSNRSSMWCKKGGSHQLKQTSKIIHGNSKMRHLLADQTDLCRTVPYQASSCGHPAVTSASSKDNEHSDGLVDDDADICDDDENYDDEDDATKALLSGSNKYRWSSLQNIHQFKISNIRNIHSYSAGSIAKRCASSEKPVVDREGKSVGHNIVRKGQHQHHMRSFTRYVTASDCDNPVCIGQDNLQDLGLPLLSSESLKHRQFTNKKCGQLKRRLSRNSKKAAQNVCDLLASKMTARDTHCALPLIESTPLDPSINQLMCIGQARLHRNDQCMCSDFSLSATKDVTEDLSVPLIVAHCSHTRLFDENPRGDDTERTVNIETYFKTSDTVEGDRENSISVDCTECTKRHALHLSNNSPHEHISTYSSASASRDWLTNQTLFNDCLCCITSCNSGITRLGAGRTIGNSTQLSSAIQQLYRKTDYITGPNYQLPCCHVGGDEGAGNSKEISSYPKMGVSSVLGREEITVAESRPCGDNCDINFEFVATARSCTESPSTARSCIESPATARSCTASPATARSCTESPATACSSTVCKATSVTEEHANIIPFEIEHRMLYDWESMPAIHFEPEDESCENTDLTSVELHGCNCSNAIFCSCVRNCQICKHVKIDGRILNDSKNISKNITSKHEAHCNGNKDLALNIHHFNPSDLLNNDISENQSFYCQNQNHSYASKTVHGAHSLRDAFGESSKLKSHEQCQTQMSQCKLKTDFKHKGLNVRCCKCRNFGAAMKGELKSNYKHLREFHKQPEKHCTKDELSLLQDRNTSDQIKASNKWDSLDKDINSPDSLRNQSDPSAVYVYGECQELWSLDSSNRSSLPETDDTSRARVINQESIRLLLDCSRISDSSPASRKSVDYFGFDSNYGLYTEDDSNRLCAINDRVLQSDFVRCDECFLASLVAILPDNTASFVKKALAITSRTKRTPFVETDILSHYRSWRQRNMKYEIDASLSKYVLDKTTASIFSSSSMYSLSKQQSSDLTHRLIWTISNQTNIYPVFTSTSLSEFPEEYVPSTLYPRIVDRITYFHGSGIFITNTTVGSSTPLKQSATKHIDTNSSGIDAVGIAEPTSDICTSILTEISIDYNLYNRFCHCKYMSHYFLKKFTNFLCPFCLRPCDLLSPSMLLTLNARRLQLCQSNTTIVSAWLLGIEPDLSGQKSIAQAIFPDCVYGSCANKCTGVVCCGNSELVLQDYDDYICEFNIKNVGETAQNPQQNNRNNEPRLLNTVLRADEINMKTRVGFSETFDLDNIDSTKGVFGEDQMMTQNVLDDNPIIIQDILGDHCSVRNCCNIESSSEIAELNLALTSVYVEPKSVLTSSQENSSQLRLNRDSNKIIRQEISAKEDITDNNFSEKEEIMNINKTEMELQKCLENISDEINYHRNVSTASERNYKDANVSLTTFQGGCDAEIPDVKVCQCNCLQQPILTSESFLLRPNDRLRQFKLSSSNIVNHALNSLVPLAVGSNKPARERDDTKCVSSSLDSQIAFPPKLENDANKCDYTDFDNAPGNDEIHRSSNTSISSNPPNNTGIDTTKTIHSTLLGCVPTFQVDEVDFKTNPSGGKVTDSDTCEFFVRTVFDTFFSGNSNPFKSDPCLSASDIDYTSSELVEFPISPILCTKVESGENKLQEARNDSSVFHIAGCSRQKINSAFDNYEASVRKIRSPKRNGSAQSWFSLDDLCEKPASSSHASMVFLSSLRRQLNNVLSPKSIRQFFGVNDSQDSKNHGRRAPYSRNTLTANQINVIITRCESLVMDKRQEMGLPPIRDRAATLDPSSMDKPSRISYESVHTYSGARQNIEGMTKNRTSSLETSYSSNSQSDDPSMMCRSQDLSMDRSCRASLDLLSPASASFRTGSMCSGISSVSKMTECSAYTEHSRSDCEKITRRTAEREHNITKLLGVITLMFVISWSVSWSVILIDNLTLVPVTDMLTTNVTLSIARNLFLVNHFCNVLVYAVLSKSFREKLTQCYKACLHCCSF